MPENEMAQDWRELRDRGRKEDNDRMRCFGDFVNEYDTYPPLGQHRFDLPAHEGEMMYCIRCGQILGRR